MKIAVLIPWFYPAYRVGGPVQSIVNMVENHSENITYNVFCSDADVDGTVLEVPTNSWVTYNKKTQIWYASKNKGSQSLLKKEFKKVAPDILFINDIYSINFSLIPLLFYKGPRKIVSARGMLHPGALSQKPFKKKLYFRLWRLAGLHKQCDFHASDAKEKMYIENVFGKNSKIFIAQNFPRIFKRQPGLIKIAGELRLISIGLISPMKNYLSVLEALKGCGGLIYYNIYGAIKDETYWSICVEQIKKLPANIIVKYYGDIPPDKVEMTLEENQVFILPSKSENFGHAIYEALTAGKPVITSNNTPWNNLKRSGAGINVDADKLHQITVAVNYFAAMDEIEYEKWNIGANHYAFNAININEIKQQYQKMFFV